MSRPLVGPAFGDTLRRLRQDRGLSIRAFAKVAYHGKTYLHELETGTRQPTAELARHLDEALGAGGQLARLVVEDTTLVDEERLAYATQFPQRADAAAVNALEALLASQRRREDAVGAAAVLGPATAQLATVTDLVVEARDDLRPRLVDVAAQWAQFVGWLNAATSQVERSDAAFSQALEWAVEADDRDMVATALSFKGYLAEGTGALGSMIGLSAAAQRDPRVYAGQLAYSAGQEARGLAIAGEDRAATAKISEATDLAARQGELAAPPWIYYYTPEFFVIQRGIVYKHLGVIDPHRNAQAVEILTAGLDAMPQAARRAEWAGVYLCHLGEAHARAGDLVSASAAAAEARAVATAARSAKVNARVDALVCRYGLSADS